MERMELSEDSRGPYLLIPHCDLAEVALWLDGRGVDFEEEADASRTCAGPVVAVLRFPGDVDRHGLAGILADLPASPGG